MIDAATATLAFNPAGPFAQNIMNLMGYISLALIVVAFSLIAALSMRSRTISSFQFELYVFILVIVIAEVPYILGNLGLMVDTPQFQLIGLIIHSCSMAFISTFILWRAFKSFGRGKSLVHSKMKPTGKPVIMQSKKSKTGEREEPNGKTQ